jgi:hypothetical protein
MNSKMTLDEIKAHNIVRATLMHNKEYRASWKLHLKDAIVASATTRNPDLDRRVVEGIAEEAAERFLTNFTK